MFQFQGIWFPDGEKHFPDWMAKNGELVNGRGTYQIKKLREAVKHCRNFRQAVDVGGHVGLWAMQLASRFQTVHSFEPVRKFAECWERNLEGSKNALLYNCALGAKDGMVNMVVDPADTGGTHVGDQGLQVRMVTLDHYDLRDVDFIKIDCEGYEHLVVQGAKETIARWRPTMIVEQKQRKLAQNYGAKGTPAVDLLKTWGYSLVREMGGDYIMVPA